MAAQKFLVQVAGVIRELIATVISAGAANDGNIPALDASGRLDSSMMPVGLGTQTAQIAASEALAAGDLVNIWTDTGAVKCRKADGSSAGKEANGFVLSAVEAAAMATVYFNGANTQKTGMTPGAMQFLSDAAPGGTVETATTTSTHVVQMVGRAVSATQFEFAPHQPITLA
jgi:hypothetical protein